MAGAVVTTEGGISRRSRRWLRVAAAVSTAAAAFAVYGAVRFNRAVTNSSALPSIETPPGFTVPTRTAPFAFSLPSVKTATTEVTLAQFAGRPIVLNFWSSTCPVCAQEAASLRSVYDRAHAAVAFVGVDTADTRSRAESFATQSGASWPLAFDPSATLFYRYGLPGLPVTLFITASGRLVGENLGALSTAGLERDLARLFHIAS